MPGTVLGSRNSTVNKPDKFPALMECTVSCRRPRDDLTAGRVEVSAVEKLKQVRALELGGWGQERPR